MRRDLNAKQISLYQSLKLFIADVRLPKTSWKAVPQLWVGSRKILVPEVSEGPPDDTARALYK